MYSLMEADPEPGAGGAGDPPPADPPPEGDPPVDSSMISTDVLPEGLKDRPAAEVKFLLDNMLSSLGTKNNEVEDLRSQVAELRGVVSVTHAPPAADPDPDDIKPLEELMLEDSAKAIDRYMKDKGYVTAFDDLSGRVGEAEFTMVAGQTPGFDEYEEDIRTILANGKLAPTAANVKGAHVMAVGQRLIETQERERRAQSSATPPSSPPAPDPAVIDPGISDLEREIARAHGITDDAEWAKSRDTPMEVNLPTG